MIVVKRSDWRHDPHAYECYTCDQRSTAPRKNPQCKGCIGRSTHPHWKPHPDFARQAIQVIKVAQAQRTEGGGTP